MNAARRVALLIALLAPTSTLVAAEGPTVLEHAGVRIPAPAAADAETVAGYRRFGTEAEGTRHTGAVKGLAIDPDGRSLHSVDTGGSYHEWDLATTRRLRHLPSGGDAATSLAVNRARVVVGHHDGLVTSFGHDDAPAAREIFQADAPIAALALAPDDSRLAVLTSDGATLHLLDPATGAVLATHEVMGRKGVDLRFATSGHFLAVGCWPAELELRDPLDGTLICHTDAEVHQADRHSVLWSLCIGPGSRFVATTGTDGSVTTWQVPAEPLPPHPLRQAASGGATDGTLNYGPRHIVAHPCGRLAVTASNDARIRVVDVPTGSVLLDRGHRAGPPQVVAIHPDGRELLAGFAGHELHGKPLFPRPSTAAHERARAILDGPLGERPARIRELWQAVLAAPPTQALDASPETEVLVALGAAAVPLLREQATALALDTDLALVADPLHREQFLALASLRHREPAVRALLRERALAADLPPDLRADARRILRYGPLADHFARERGAVAARLLLAWIDDLLDGPPPADGLPAAEPTTLRHPERATAAETVDPNLPF